MQDDEILDLYEWSPGRCFRHPSREQSDTARVRTIGSTDVRACRDCVLAMEAEREQAARSAGRSYSPGYAGHPLP